MEGVDRVSNLKATFRSLKWYEAVMMAVMVAVAGEQLAESLASAEAHNPAWLAGVNFASALCGVVCIFFTAKASVSACVFGIANTAAYSVYLAYWHVYGTLCLEVLVYLPVSVGQWIIWARHRDRVERRLTQVRRLGPLGLLAAASSVGCGAAAYWLVLDAAGGSAVLWDSLTVSIGVVAVVLSMLRYREQYVLWLITDVVAVAMFVELSDPVYLVKKSIYLIMALVGLRNWWRLSARSRKPFPGAPPPFLNARRTRRRRIRSSRRQIQTRTPSATSTVSHWPSNLGLKHSMPYLLPPSDT